MTNQQGSGLPSERRAGDRGADPALDRYLQIFEAVALPVLLIDSETLLIVAANHAAISQYGYSREEFIGLPALEIRPPEGRGEALKVLSSMPHGSWKATAVAHQRKDGSLFSADVWSRDAVVDGRNVRVSTISDVTERVQLQHDLQQAQKMEAVGRLAGGIAHDFNNALTSIIVGAELLAEHLAGDRVATADLADIRKAADRAALLTQRLLAYSRQQVMRIEVVPLNDLVVRCEPLLRHAIGGRVDLVTRLEPAAWSVRVDPVHFEQVIMNLAINAQDAMPDGGTFTLATRNVSFARDSAAEGVTIPAGRYAELTASDDGTGMDTLTRARVFEPFFTTKPPPEGTGLGLSMAYGIVRQSQGFITVDSTLGSGTTFRILLPRVGEEHAEVPVLVPRAKAPGDRTALVVEDEDSVRRVMCRVLEQLGHTVLSAENGEAALALVEADRPDLDVLVTDLIMPRMGGRELATQLCATFPDLRVLFVSGYTEDATGYLGMLDPGKGFLRKPFSIDSLNAAVRRVLEGT